MPWACWTWWGERDSFSVPGFVDGDAHASLIHRRWARWWWRLVISWFPRWWEGYFNILHVYIIFCCISMRKLLEWFMGMLQKGFHNVENVFLRCCVVGTYVPRAGFSWFNWWHAFFILLQPNEDLLHMIVLHECFRNIKSFVYNFIYHNFFLQRVVYSQEYCAWMLNWAKRLRWQKHIMEKYCGSMLHFNN